MVAKLKTRDQGKGWVLGLAFQEALIRYSRAREKKANEKEENFTTAISIYGYNLPVAVAT